MLGAVLEVTTEDSSSYTRSGDIYSSQVMRNMFGAVGVIVAVILTGLGGAMAQTKRRPSQNDPWYRNLKRSPLNPPDRVFGIVWPILYVTIGIAGYSLFQKYASSYAKADSSTHLIVFFVQLLLNGSFSWLFFRLHLIVTAQICILANWASIAYLIFWAQETILWPLLLWLSFASYLGGYIVMHNPSEFSQKQQPPKRG